MAHHRLVSGELVELHLSSAAQDFFARAHVMAHDPGATLCDLVELIYGDENPLLDRTVVPGVSVVTHAIHTSGSFQALLDLIARKRMLAAATPASPAPRQEHPVSVPEAARRLGISTSAVRHAILRGSLPAVKRSGQYWLRHEDVTGYRVTRRGPPPATERSPALQVRVGEHEDAAIGLRHDGRLELTRDLGHATEGELLDWSRAVVRAARGGARSVAFYELRPGKVESEITVGALHVRGRFRIIRKIVEPAAAEKAWRASPLSDGDDPREFVS